MSDLAYANAHRHDLKSMLASHSDQKRPLRLRIGAKRCAGAWADTAYNLWLLGVVIWSHTFQELEERVEDDKRATMCLLRGEGVTPHCV